MATLTSPDITDLIVDVRNMLNQPDARNSFWTDEELTAYLNEAIRRYFVEVVHQGEGQFTTTATLDITANVETIALPSDFFKIKNVWRVVTNGYSILHYRNSLDESYSTQGEGGGDTYRPNYYLRGNNLVLRPMPNFTQSAGLLIEYVQFPSTMITGGDALTAQVSPIFKDLIIMYACYKAKLKESGTTGGGTWQPFYQNLNDLFTAFKEVIQGMSMGSTFVQLFNPED